MQPSDVSTLRQHEQSPSFNDAKATEGDQNEDQNMNPPGDAEDADMNQTGTKRPPSASPEKNQGSC